MLIAGAVALAGGAVRPEHRAGSAQRDGQPSLGYRGSMCRNITTLRGLQPSATAEEIEAAARQYVRKVSGVQQPTAATRDPFDDAVAEVARATARLLAELPERRRPPATVPPLRRPEVRARLAASAGAAPAAAHRNR